MIRGIIIIVLLSAALLVWKAPAGMLRNAFNEVQGVDLVDTAGSLWSGQGRLLVDQGPLGRLTWEIEPGALLGLQLAYRVRLLSDDIDLQGTLRGTPSGFGADLQGLVTNAALNRLAGSYDMTLAGDVRVEALHLAAAYDRRIEALRGTLRWQGGPVTYPEAGGMQRAELPPLFAELADDAGHAVARVFSEGGTTPLLHVRTLDGGYYRLGVTKLLTRMVGRPWRGSDPDHQIVLELEEQFL